MKVIKEILNPLKLSFSGTRIIEASAGTGKTYTLVVIYLRLILGLGGESDYFRPLGVEEILLVTFTEAATEELRCRIRETIRRFRFACMRGHTEDIILSNLLLQLSNIDLSIQQLLTAERQIDKAAIFTIHGFCQHILTHSALELETCFQHTLLTDESLLLYQIISDFWRRHCYPLPIEIAKIVHTYWKGPEDLLKEIFPYIYGEFTNIFPIQDTRETIIDRHNRMIAYIDWIKQELKEKVDEALSKLMNNNNIDRNIYTKKNIAIWKKKIKDWINNPTYDYKIPKSLKRFRSSELNGTGTIHQLFESIEKFYKFDFSLRTLIFIMALEDLKISLNKEKQKIGAIGFDDLLRIFDKSLDSENGDNIAKTVRTRYPVAMIDEFQDTDPRQYRIFYRIYKNKIRSSLILISDPKQAIYGFRGADIFTYMRASNEADYYYTLEKNWRSSVGMVNAVNKLFQSISNPFIFQEIPFIPVSASDRNANLRFVVKQNTQPAMHFWVQQSSDIVDVIEYRKVMAKQCATTLRNWLNYSQKGEAWIENMNGRRPLQASDMTILVRNSSEANIIHYALNDLRIPSVYLSNRESVFESTEAKELLLIIQAVLEPEKNLLCALATSLLGFNAREIDIFNRDDNLWEKTIDEFYNYRIFWKKFGIFPMLYKIIGHFRIAEKLLYTKNNICEQRLTNILHLGELLQEASIYLENEYSVERWLSMKIKSKNFQDVNVNQQTRLKSDIDLVKIITIHKSKGLEFPIVFLPFASDFRMNKKKGPIIIHDRKTYQPYLDFGSNNFRLAEEERLSEDIRIFYVAVTRAIYHCSIGIAPIIRRKNSNKIKTNDLHLSAPGYLINKGKYCDVTLLQRNLRRLIILSGGDISFCFTPLEFPIFPMKFPTKVEVEHTFFRNFSYLRNNDYWKVTSYTDLIESNHKRSMEIDRYYRNMNSKDGIKLDFNVLTPTKHTFPSGSLPGIFLHSLFESLDFTKQLDIQWLRSQIEFKSSLDADVWLSVIHKWIELVMQTPLDEQTRMMLSNISSKDRCTEFAFYFPITDNLESKHLNTICKRYDLLSARSPYIEFTKFKGMMKGLIDLVFRWKDRYYLLDYKSNRLGENGAAYTKAAIEKEMVSHRYDLQYQIYTLAIHRFLRKRLVNYDYNRDFGGIFYLFLRGIDYKKPGYSIYSCRPELTLIHEMDDMFSSYS